MKKVAKPARSAGAPPKGARRSTKRTEAEADRSPKKGERARVRVEHCEPQPDPAPSAKEIREHRRGKASEAARKYYDGDFGPPGGRHVLQRACAWANADKMTSDEFIWTAENLAAYNRAELARRAADATLARGVAATPADNFTAASEPASEVTNEKNVGGRPHKDSARKNKAALNDARLEAAELWAAEKEGDPLSTTRRGVGQIMAEVENKYERAPAGALKRRTILDLANKSAEARRAGAGRPPLMQDDEHDHEGRICQILLLLQACMFCVYASQVRWRRGERPRVMCM